MAPPSCDGPALVTDADVHFYREHGWFISQRIIPEDLLELARFGAERLHAGERDAVLLPPGAPDWMPGDDRFLRLNDYASLQNEQLRQLALFAAIGATAMRLCGSPRVRLFHDQLIAKPPVQGEQQGTVGWHTDRAYWRTCTSHEMLTAWVPLQDCDATTGCLTVVDGSHRWRGTSWMRTFDREDLGQLEGAFGGGRVVVKVPLQMRRGQVSFHHCRTIHGSLPNRGPAMRLALAIHMQDDSNRYRSRRSDGSPAFHAIDSLCRLDAEGLPDYGDPDICPVLAESSAQ